MGSPVARSIAGKVAIVGRSRVSSSSWSQLERENPDLKKIVADHEAIHVLKAEWGHLNEIERVRSLSTRYLDLRPTSPARIVTLDELPSAVEPQIQAQAPAPAKKTVTR
mgnify:CR=1 FL=1